MAVFLLKRGGGGDGGFGPEFNLFLLEKTVKSEPRKSQTEFQPLI